MIYTVDNTSKIGKPVKLIVDANGLVWDHVLSVDTETGEITQWMLDEDGKVKFDENGEALVEHVKTAAPVRVVFE